ATLFSKPVSMVATYLMHGESSFEDDCIVKRSVLAIYCAYLIKQCALLAQCGHYERDVLK
ncbi:hypothetical protein, partial [Cronobacter dublinensis]|uniref:hypothetical protein n=1 Tax=Cronobacter dublinensis TaxID=413497 RepID=UPI001F28BF8A